MKPLTISDYISATIAIILGFAIVDLLFRGSVDVRAICYAVYGAWFMFIIQKYDKWFRR